MNEEEIKELKSRVDKLTCGMTEEETNKLYRKIIEYINEPIIEYINCEINVNDLSDTTREFRKKFDYDELIIDNHKKQQEIERLNNIINELEKDFKSYDLEYLRETYQGSLADFIETELKRIQELKIGVNR